MLISFFINANATHNVAGEITYTHISGKTYEITLTTYTDPSQFVDRCTANIRILNSSNILVDDLQEIPRINGPLNVDAQFPGVQCSGQNMGEYIVGTIKKNIYKVTYTFPGDGVYKVTYNDQNRLDNIVNMTSSGDQSFFIESSIVISGYLGEQNSAQFLNHPIDFACTGKLWTHNPGAWDPDGDSLSFKLVPNRQQSSGGVISVCNGYVFPQNYGSNGPMTMDATTGLITWSVPNDIGIYNIAYKVEEWRNGVLMDTLYRDMAIFVEPCDNNPPVIETITDTCIMAGEFLQFPFVSYDPDFLLNGDSLYLYLNNNNGNNNGPFSVPVSPATITFNPAGTPPIEHDDTISGVISWQTTCDHVRNSFYQIDFYAHDNFGYYFQPGTQMLSAHHVVKIWVNAPPVTGLTAVPGNKEIFLNWDPHPCDSTIKYEIYRKFGSAGWQPDTVCCDLDPLAAGFSLIASVNGINNTSYTDDNNNQNFPFGVDICYLVRAVLSNGVKSCPGEEVCIQLAKGQPYLTKDSIDITASNGQIAVNWVKPDTIDPFYPAPYTYTLMRADGISGTANWTTIATGIPLNDTTYIDAGMNTVTQGYRYRVDLYDGTQTIITEGNDGSSIFLTVTPGDGELTLQWKEFVPWNNRLYDIYRATNFGGPYVYLTTVAGNGMSTHRYTDSGLTNFEEYCYVVVSEGEYGSSQFPDSVRNASQKTCAIPIDLTPPCTETIDLDTAKNCVSHLINFSWNEPDSICGADVDFYSIYYSDHEGGPFELIATVDSGNYFYTVPNLTTIADCYGVTATDTSGNESEMIIYCFENCPEIEISNVFTPNGDGVNDFFSPVNDRNVRIAEVQIFDRWGNSIYNSKTVPDVSQIWNGKTYSGKDAPEGVYYYFIRYEEDRLPNYVMRPPLTGYVTLMR